MSITLEQAKDFLNVYHAHDDAKIQRLLNGAIREAMEFLDREDPGNCGECESSSSETVEWELPEDAETGVLFLLQSVYQATPDERMKLRKAAEDILMPHRCGLGI